MNDFDNRPGFDKRAWNGLKYLEGAAEPGLTIDSLIERCDVVTVGIHAAGIDVISGMAVLGRDKADGTWLALMNGGAIRLGIAGHVHPVVNIGVLSPRICEQSNIREMGDLGPVLDLDER